ncbi:unnamed protein product [Orchesella dallaii]|uniref:C-type lectin domain-containing protein n=1 Tax=Orchesella dallaii TaxID=48710 RepID=A0ABP1R1I6_9HEXA
MARVNTSDTILAVSFFKFSLRIFTIALFLGFFQPVYNEPKNLSLPKPALCAARKTHFRLGSSGYYVSWLEKDTRNLFLNWLDARNWCRDRCMDLISMETAEEIRKVKQLMKQSNTKYCWTSGRLCDFTGCDRNDLQPLSVNGWFWSGSGAKLRPTNERSELNDWSYTGALNVPQPDNREKKKGGYAESCLAILNNYYNDGIKWHDVACHHIKSFVCEDSLSLLNYVRSTNKNSKLRF